VHGVLCHAVRLYRSPRRVNYQYDNRVSLSIDLSHHTMNEVELGRAPLISISCDLTVSGKLQDGKATLLGVVFLTSSTSCRI
jgi:hypothetical protein